MAFPEAAGRYGDPRPGPNLSRELMALLDALVSRFGSVRSLRPFGSSPSHTPVTGARSRCWHRAHATAAGTGSRYASPFVSIAHTPRAILLASVIATSIRGFFASMRASQEPRRSACDPASSIVTSRP